MNYRPNIESIYDPSRYKISGETSRVQQRIHVNADAIISVSCAGVVGMFRVGSVTVLVTTLNVVGAVEEEEDMAPEVFLLRRVVAWSTLNSKIDDVQF